MARIRLGKRERLLRKAQHAQYRALKADLIADNVANIKELPTSRGYRSVNLLEGYSFHGASNMARPDMRGADRGFAKQRY